MAERLSDQQFARLEAKRDSGALHSAALRTARLKALLLEVRSARREVLGALQSDFSQSAPEAWRYEFAPVLKALRRALRRVRWEKLRNILRSRATRPRGVVLVTADWGRPWSSLMTGVVNAVAAGNCVVLKSVPEAQSVMGVAARIIRAVFPEDEVMSADAGMAELLKFPFDDVYFAGTSGELPPYAETVARRLGDAHWRVLRRHWCIVQPGIGISAWARAIVRGKFLNAGQYDGAPDCLLVHRKVKDKLLLALRGSIRGLYGPNPEQSRVYGRIVNDFHYERLTALLREGRLVAGGEHHPDDRYIAPTVIDALSEDCALLREPVRGPILPVLEFETFGEALAVIRRRSKGGVVSIFGSTCRSRERLADAGMEKVFCGGIADGDYLWRPEDFRREIPVTRLGWLRGMLRTLGRRFRG